MRVLILGYGEMGHAMERLLAPRYRLSIWEKFPKGDFQSARLEETVPAADCVIFCLPAEPHASVLARIVPDLKPGALCISIAKGLDDSGHSACRIFEDGLGHDHDYALLYGPMISEEIRAGRCGFAQAGCRTRAVFERVWTLFRGSGLYLCHSSDLHGISWSVILKNIYAIGFGIIDELDLGDNTRGFLMVRALEELSRIVVDMGGEPGTPYQLSGLGDLITTATSEDSHHHALGGRLARGETRDIGGEGVHTLAMITEHRLLDMNRYPLMETINRIVGDPRRAAEDVDRYIENWFHAP